MCAEINILLIKLFLYLSNFNFIETSFFVLKAWIKKHYRMIENYDDNNKKFEQFFRDAVSTQNTVNNADNLFKLANIQYSSLFI